MNEKALYKKTNTIVIQLNGKKRGILECNVDNDEKKIIELIIELISDENPNPDIKDDYGCLLFASRIDKLKGRWDDKNLIKEARKYKDIPVYYYSEFDLKDTEWDKLFPIRYNFADLNLNLRQQMLIKSRAKFNIGYQAGINDAVSKHSNNIILTPYDDIKENIIRNVKYIHFNGSIKQI